MIIEIIEIFFVLLLLAFSFIFSGSEVSLLSISEVERLKLQHAKKGKDNLISNYLSQPQNTLIAILIGNMIVNLSASIVGEQLSNKIFLNNSLVYSVFIMTFFVLLFGEIVPKNIAASNPMSFSRNFIWIIDISYKLFYPLLFLITKFISSRGENRKKIHLSKEELISAIDVSTDAGLDSISIEILKNMIGLIDRPVTDFMIPRSDIQAVDITAPWEDISKFISNSPYSSVIFYDKNIDNIVGYANKIDLVNIKEKQLSTVLQEPLFIPEPKKVVSVLSELKNRKVYIAVILDEYGGTTGLITLKDILDYIFIKDMMIKNLIKKSDKSVWTVSGDTKIFDVNVYFDIDLPVEFNTISGYLVNMIGRIPAEGSILTLTPGINVKILKSDSKQVELLEIKRIEK